MGFRKKTLRYRGSRSYGRGFGCKNKSGSKGGTGRGGIWTHKKFSRILELKKIEEARKIRIINLKQIELYLCKFLKKGFLIRVAKDSYATTDKFANFYSKITGDGELSFKLKTNVKTTKSVKLKLS